MPRARRRRERRDDPRTLRRGSAQALNAEGFHLGPPAARRLHAPAPRPRPARLPRPRVLGRHGPQRLPPAVDARRSCWQDAATSRTSTAASYDSFRGGCGDGVMVDVERADDRHRSSAHAAARSCSPPGTFGTARIVLRVARPLRDRAFRWSATPTAYVPMLNLGMLRRARRVTGATAWRSSPRWSSCPGPRASVAASSRTARSSPSS